MQRQVNKAAFFQNRLFALRKKWFLRIYFKFFWGKLPQVTWGFNWSNWIVSFSSSLSEGIELISVYSPTYCTVDVFFSIWSWAIDWNFFVLWALKIISCYYTSGLQSYKGINSLFSLLRKVHGFGDHVIQRRWLLNNAFSWAKKNDCSQYFSLLWKTGCFIISLLRKL